MDRTDILPGVMTIQDRAYWITVTPETPPRRRHSSPYGSMLFRSSFSIRMHSQPQQ
jgi:hypothetical protein